MGQVRIPVTIDKAEQALRELKQISTGIKHVGDDAKRSATALDQIGRAYTSVRRNVELFNQFRGVLTSFVNVARSAVYAIESMAQRTPRTRQELDGLRASAGRVADEFVRGLDSGGAFSGMLRAMNLELTETEDSARVAGTAVAGLGSALSRVNRVAAAIQSAGLSELFRAIGGTARRAEQYLVRGGAMAGGESFQGLAHIPGEEDLPRPGRGAGDAGAGSSRWDDAPRRRGRGGGAGAGQAFYSQAGATGASESALGTETAITGQYQAQAEALREVFANLDTIAALEQRRLDSASRSREVEREQADKTKEQLTQQMEVEQELAARRKEWSSGFIASVGSIANAAQNLGKSVASAYEAMGGSSEKAKKIEGAFVVAYSSVMAALELAESIRAFAKQDYVSGALHLVGMAAYIAAAVEAGSQLGGGAAKTPSAQTSYQAARTEGLGAPSGEQAGKTIVNQYSYGRSRGETAEALADVEYEGARTGRVRALDTGVWGA